MKKRLVSCILAVSCASVFFAGCGSKDTTGNKTSKEGTHEPITINTPYNNIDAFVDKVHEKYPEINFEVVSYSGYNTTSWMRAMLKADQLTDIYFTSMYSPENDAVSDKLLDLSGYSFTDNYVQARLREVTVDGGVYMLPLSYSCIGITYNKTLLEKNGWELPKSLKEMEQLRPKVEEAGYQFCLDLTQFPGYGFQYLCNILDTGFLSTTDGLRWQSDYLAGNANVSNTPKMLESMKLLDRWKELGLLTNEKFDMSDTETKNLYKEGNTLFCVGNSTELSTENGVIDEYKLMPYLSEDGDQNVFVLNVNRYVGLSKHLEESGNEQKLEDAKHVLEVLSTEEGMWALNDQRGSVLLPLNDATVEPSSYYSEVIEELNSGHTAPFIYAGWDDIIVPIGEKVLDYIKGDASLQDVIDCVDENQSNLKEAKVYTTVTETLDTEDCAKLVGIGFAKAVGADAALISKNEYHAGAVEMNWAGVNGSLFAIPLTDQEITSILPTGWKNTIQTVTLSGERIKELEKTGYDRNGDGNPFPYELVTKEGMVLEDDTMYTVVICGATDEVQTEGNLQDSGVVGLDAMKEYLSSFKTLSKADIIWK